MMEGINSTMIYRKNFYKSHNVPQHNSNKKEPMEDRSKRVNTPLSFSMS
jgi:hypothetical protein